MKFHARCTLMLVALASLIALTPVQTGATVVKHLELGDLVSKATKIVQVTVRSSATTWDENNARIWTTYSLDVIDTLKGSENVEMAIRVRGGTVGDRAQYVSGSPHLKDGDEYLLFLWIDNDQRYRILGMGQGRFRVDRPEGEAATTCNSFQGVTVVQTTDGEEEVQKAGPICMELETFIDTVRDLAGTAIPDEDEDGGEEGSLGDGEEGEGE